MADLSRRDFVRTGVMAGLVTGAIPRPVFGQAPAQHHRPGAQVVQQIQLRGGLDALARHYGMVS